MTEVFAIECLSGVLRVICTGIRMVKTLGSCNIAKHQSAQIAGNQLEDGLGML